MRRAATRGLIFLMDKTGPGLTARCLLKPLLRVMAQPPPNEGPYVAVAMADCFGHHIIERDLLPFLLSKTEAHSQKVGGQAWSTVLT